MKKMFVLVLALVMTFAALPAFAQDKADWAFYGSVRMWTAWESVDEDTPAQPFHLWRLLSCGGDSRQSHSVRRHCCR